MSASSTMVVQAPLLPCTVSSRPWSRTSDVSALRSTWTRLRLSLRAPPLNRSGHQIFLDAAGMDASEFYDTTDAGRLTSSANSFGVSGSQTQAWRNLIRKVESFSCVDLHSSAESSVRNLERLSSVEPFSSFGKPLSMGKGIRRLCKILKWKGKEFCQDYLREWRMRNTEVAFSETGMQLQSQKMELYQANQLTDQTRREKSWLCDEFATRNKAFQEDRARCCQ